MKNPHWLTVYFTPLERAVIKIHWAEKPNKAEQKAFDKLIRSANQRARDHQKSLKP